MPAPGPVSTATPAPPADAAGPPAAPVGAQTGAMAARLRRAVSWNLAATVAAQGTTFITAVLLAHALGREGFGRFAMVQGALSTLTQVASLATGYTATRYIAELRAADPGRAGRVMGLCAVVSTVTAVLAAVALALGAPWLARAALHAPELAVPLAIAAAAVFFTVQVGYQSGALAGLEAFRPVALSAAVGGVAGIAAAVLGARMAGVAGAVCGVAAGYALQWAVQAVLLRRECRRAGLRPTWPGISGERRVLVHFAIPAAASGFVLMPSMWAATAFLARRPGGFAQVAVYTAANNFRVLVLFLPTVLNAVVLSLLSHHKGAGEARRVRRLFWLNVRLTAGIAVAGALALGALGPWLLRLFGRSFAADGGAVLWILLGAAVAEAVTAAPYQVVQAHERMWESLFYIVLPRSLLLVGVAWVLAPRSGAVGIALAYLAAMACALAATVVLAGRLGLPGESPGPGS